MAETIKISALTEIPSGALDDNSVLPVVDGGVTYKLPVTKLKAFIGDSFATDAELSAQISSVNSTISGLTTTAISEGSNQYYTNTRVKNYIGGENVVSSSQQITNLGFYSGPTAIKSALPEGTISSSAQVNLASVTGNTTTNVSEGTNQYYTDARVKTKLNVDGIVSGSSQITYSGLSFIPVGIVSGSSQVTTLLPNGIISSSAQVIPLLPIGVISGSSQLPQGIISGSQQITPLLPNGVVSGSQQIIGFVNSNETSSMSVLNSVTASYINPTFISASAAASGFGSGGGGSVPLGTVSSSAQIVLADANKTGFDTSMVTEAPVGNLYFQNERVYALLEPLNQFSGSINAFTSSVGGVSVPNGTISSSQQITNFGFVSSSGIISGSQQILQLLPQGTVSSSQQITNLGFAETAVVGTTITSTVTNAYIKDRLPLNTVSSSAQLTASFVTIEGLASVSSSFSGRISVLEAEEASFTANLVSGSSQINYLGLQNQLQFIGKDVTILQTNNRVEISGSTVSYSDVTNKPLGLVSGSIQISNLGFVDTFAVDAAITSFSSSLTTTVNQIISDIDTIEGNYAWTGSNTFEGNQTINGNLSVTGSITGDSFIVGGAGTPIIESATNLEISASADINIFSQNMVVSSSIYTNKPFTPGTFTDAQTGSLSVSSGAVIFNSTRSKLQVFVTSAFVDLH
jgi:hypothetical protein